VVVIDDEAEEAAVRSGQEEEPVRIDQAEAPAKADRLAGIGDTLPEEPKRRKKWWQFGKGGEE
jgi:hypothetical protein